MNAIHYSPNRATYTYTIYDLYIYYYYYCILEERSQDFSTGRKVTKFILKISNFM